MLARERVTGRAHAAVESRLSTGQSAVDATAGNGHDTVFLAGLVGVSGTVWAFDVQGAALRETGRRLASAGLAGRCHLVAAGHEHLREHVPGPVAAVMFNLGYLPGSDRRVVTRPDTTLRALDAARGLLAPGGVLTVAVYTGHAGGGAEAAAVRRWAAAPDRGDTVELDPPGVPGEPFLLKMVRGGNRSSRG